MICKILFEQKIIKNFHFCSFSYSTILIIFFFFFFQVYDKILPKLEDKPLKKYETSLKYAGLYFFFLQKY